MTDSMQEKCVLIAAGGTGGHVIPALEIAKALRGRGWECVFVGTTRGLENRMVPKAGFTLRHVPIGALNRVSARRRLGTLLTAPRAIAMMMALVQRCRPAVALSLGGYSSGPLVAACALLDVPLVLLEPNARPGLANRLAAPAARRALVGYAQALTCFRAGTAEVIGMPVRPEFFRARARPTGAPFTVLVLGGSLGATRLNQAAVDAARIWYSERLEAPRLQHQTGERDHAAVTRAYQDLGFEVETAAFFEDVPQRFAQADLVICRAGASVLAELCAARKPAVLVPFPFAADDHQTVNGQALAEVGGALLVQDRDWTGPRMVQEVASLKANRARLEAMAAALEPLALAGATESAADAVAEAAERSGGV